MLFYYCNFYADFKLKHTIYKETHKRKHIQFTRAELLYDYKLLIRLACWPLKELEC